MSRKKYEIRVSSEVREWVDRYRLASILLRVTRLADLVAVMDPKPVAAAFELRRLVYTLLLAPQRDNE